MLACCYLAGTGVIKSEASYVKWLSRAASQGHVSSLATLQHLYGSDFNHAVTDSLDISSATAEKIGPQIPRNNTRTQVTNSNLLVRNTLRVWDGREAEAVLELGGMGGEEEKQPQPGPKLRLFGH